MFRTLEMRTEIEVMGRASIWEDRGDHVVQKTPSEPDYWYGNRVIWREEPLDLAAQIAATAAAFPGARHGVLTWDIPGMAPPEAFPNGWELDHAQTMALSGDLIRAPDPGGLALREITAEADWAQVLALQIETTKEDYPEAGESHAGFVRRRFEHRRAECAAGHSAWFGAFDGETLAGEMGIVIGHGLARYQNVETAERYRRRGIASALLGHCLDWARSRDPKGLPVIVADHDSAPGRLYGRAGFEVVETVVSLLRPGY